MRRRTSSSIAVVVALFALVATAAPSAALTDFADASAPLRVSTDTDPRLTYPAGENQAEPHVAVDPTNPPHLLAGAQEGRYYDAGAQAVGSYISFDGGETWTGGLLPDLTLATGGPWDRATDPVVAFGPDGTAYFDVLALNMHDDATAIVNFTSNDGGLT